ncbi:MAG: 50S ribosomal protein L35 [Christensenellales bacterium]|jgi:large subunit ribosomal protein L35
MPKQKTHSSSKKRFSLTATGKVKRKRANTRHILTEKTSKRKRQLRRKGYVSDTVAATVKTLIPYK